MLGSIVAVQVALLCLDLVPLFSTPHHLLTFRRLLRPPTGVWADVGTVMNRLLVSSHSGQ